MDLAAVWAMGESEEAAKRVVEAVMEVEGWAQEVSRERVEGATAQAEEEGTASRGGRSNSCSRRSSTFRVRMRTSERQQEGSASRNRRCTQEPGLCPSRP